MAEQILGFRLSAASGAWQALTEGYQFAMTPVVALESGFAKRIGVWGLKATGSLDPRPQLAIWDSDVSTGLPAALLGYTSAFSMSATGSGILYEAGVVWSRMDASLGVSGAGLRLVAGRKYWIGLHNEVATAYVALVIEGAWAWYYLPKPAGNPTDPFGPGPTPYAQARAAMYAVYEPATGPVVTITGPAALITSSIPTLTATVVDAEAVAPIYDRMSSYLVEMRVLGQTALLWQPGAFLASNTERAGFAISRPYAGPAIGPGSYQVRMQATDDAGAIGPWTAWYNFAIATQGQINTTGATPTGKLESGVVTAWSASATHPTGLSTNGVRVRIKSAGFVVRGGDDLALNPFRTITAVAPGFPITIADSITGMTQGLNGALPPGSYTWEMQGRDTAGGISAWSAGVPFRINFPPDTPTGLQPESGARSSVRPTLSWLVDDEDAEDVLGVDLVSDWEITRLTTGVTTSGTTSNVDPLTGRGFFVVTSTQMPAADEYQWRVRGRDLSAVSVGNGLGGWSAPAIFRLILAPIVAITSPSEGATVQTSTPQVAWTVSTDSGGQAFYRVEVFLPSDPLNAFWGSGIQPASNNAGGVYSIPAGVLKNGTIYDLRITIWGAGDIESTSTKRRITVAFDTALNVNNVVAGVLKTDFDFEPNVVTLNWAVTAYAANQFAGYLVSRRTASEDSREAVVIAHIRQAGQTWFADYHAPPNTDLIYAVSQLRKFGSDVRQSPETEVAIAVPLTTPVIASMLSGADLRAPVMMLGDEFSQGFRKAQALLDIWGAQGRPMLVRSPRGYGHVPISVGIFLMDDERGTLHEHMARWTAIVESGDPVSLRTETRRWICAINATEDWMHRTEHVGVMKVELSLTEIFWNEAVEVIT